MPRKPTFSDEEVFNACREIEAKDGIHAVTGNAVGLHLFEQTGIKSGSPNRLAKLALQYCSEQMGFDDQEPEVGSSDVIELPAPLVAEFDNLRTALDGILRKTQGAVHSAIATIHEDGIKLRSQEVAMLDNRLSEAIKLQQMYSTELDASVEREASYETEREGFEATIAELGRVIEGGHATAKDLREALDERVRQVADLNHHLHIANAQIASLKASEAQLQVEVNDISRERDQLKGAASSLQKEKAALEAQVRDLSSRLTTAEVAASSAATDRAALMEATKAMGGLEADKATLVARVADLEASISDKQAKHDEALNRALSKVRDLELEMARQSPASPPAKAPVTAGDESQPDLPMDRPRGKKQSR